MAVLTCSVAIVATRADLGDAGRAVAGLAGIAFQAERPAVSTGAVVRAALARGSRGVAAAIWTTFGIADARSVLAALLRFAGDIAKSAMVFITP